jgi:hypothetical protein
MGPVSPKKQETPKKGDTSKKKPSDLKFKNGNLSAQGTEGAPLVQTIEIDSQNFPHGPFRLFAEGFPVGTTAKITTSSTIQIDYTPGYNFVLNQSSRQVEGQIHVLDPDNNVLDGKVTWTIAAANIAPFVSGTSEVQPAPSYNFALVAEDLNGSNFPVWTLLPTDSSTNLGNIQALSSQIQPSAQLPNPRTVFSVTWSDVPQKLLGTTITLKFQACITSTKLCTAHDVLVHLPAPVKAEAGSDTQ